MNRSYITNYKPNIMSNITDKTNKVKLLDKLLDKVIEARSHNWEEVIKQEKHLMNYGT